MVSGEGAVSAASLSMSRREMAWAAIRKLADDVRDRVLERAAIKIYQGGIPPEEADIQALREEAGVLVPADESDLDVMAQLRRVTG